MFNGSRGSKHQKDRPDGSLSYQTIKNAVNSLYKQRMSRYRAVYPGWGILLRPEEIRLTAPQKQQTPVKYRGLSVI